jgi:hypothetical protein
MAAWFAVLVSIGEGWHFVPGNGHWAALPDGRGLVVGEVARADVGRVPDAGLGLTDRRPDDLPLKNAATCLICRVSGQAKLPRVAFDGPSWESSSQPLADPEYPVSAMRISSVIHARAPPRV